MRIEHSEASLAQAQDLLCRAVAAAGGRALLVGGSVRDSLLGRPVSDLDFGVFGREAARLQQVLEEHFELDLVGQSFGVLKVRRIPIDVALPRRESKRGSGHRGFAVDSDPHMSPKEAASRRDFTVNAIAFDPLGGEVLDPWHGRRDLEQRVLRHVSAKFAEDPLRVLRGMQMAARFRLEPASETVLLCRRIEPEGLAEERIFEEWRKLLLRGEEISRGLRFLRETGWLRHFPELEALVHCPQDPEWHPEGDVWVHTLHVLDAFARDSSGDPWDDLVVGLACLCHDLGKPSTTSFVDGRWRSPGHEEAGEAPTRTFLERMTRQQKLIEQVVPLVREHLKPIALYKAGSRPPAVRRLARRVGRIDRLIRVCRADQAGRPPLPADFPAGDWLVEQAAALDLAASAPRPLVLGRHLIALGLEPGPSFGPILEACFEAQLDGAFRDLDGGLERARLEVAAYQRKRTERRTSSPKTSVSGS
ncbi:MAG: HD domain-containing protein [Holophagales bacterium]|nr:HD domain-containing protein [Holophagales bacterium]